MATTDRRRGGALLAVLWLSAALAAIAFSLAGTVRGEAERASTAVDGLRSYYLAAGAVERATLHMLWAFQHPALARAYKPGTSVLHFPFPTGEAVVEIVPEAARFNINLTPPEELHRLLVALGVEPGRAREIALAIVDWRTPIPDQAAGPFDSFYLSLKPSFRARHASFEEIEELLLVKGMTPDIYYGAYEHDPAAPEGAARLVARGGLANCVSVYGVNDRFDVNTAEPAVLAAIGVPPQLIAALVERRRAAPFSNQEELMRFVGPAAGPGVQRLRIGGNSIFTLRATARLRLSNGQLSDLRRSVAAQVKFMPQGYDAPYHVLRWYDTAWTQ